MIPAIIAKYLGGRALKAVAGGITTSVVGGALTGGFTEGLTPFAHDLGAQLGSALGLFIVGHIAVYLPKNKGT